MDSDTVISDQVTLFDPNATNTDNPSPRGPPVTSSNGLHVSFNVHDDEGLSTPPEVIDIDTVTPSSTVIPSNDEDGLPDDTTVVAQGPKIESTTTRVRSFDVNRISL